MHPLDPDWLASTVAIALDEDLGPAPGRDVTTQATVPPDETGTAHLVARGPAKIPASRMVSLARAQNGFGSLAELREGVRRGYEAKGITNVTFSEPGR